MLDLPLETIISYAKRYDIEYRKELEELKEFEKELFGEEGKISKDEEYLPREKQVEEEKSEEVTKITSEYEDSAQKLHTLVGQSIIYKKNLKEVIAVILDPGTNINIDNFIKTLEELKVNVIRLYGNIRRIGKKGEVVIKLRR